jgi:hypothetical protein
MPGPIHRNLVVKYFGTPNDTEGSVNEPREREENGMRFNEKWVYRHPLRDPADALERTIYWRRYDYVGSVIRTATDGPATADDGLPAFLQQRAAALDADPTTHIAE